MIGGHSITREPITASACWSWIRRNRRYQRRSSLNWGNPKRCARM
jgi:hypothetical protein